MCIPIGQLDRALTYNKPAIVSCDGEVTWDNATGTLAWDGPLRIVFNREDGVAIQNVIATGSLVLLDNQFAVVPLNDTNDTTISASAATLTPGAVSNFLAYNVFVLAYKNATSDNLSTIGLPPISTISGDGEARISGLESEISTARGGSETLDARLDNLETEVGGVAGDQVAAHVYAGPIFGEDAPPAFRALVASDIPTLAVMTEVVTARKAYDTLDDRLSITFGDLNTNIGRNTTELIGARGTYETLEERIDAISVPAGDTNAEVVAARDGAASLDARLDTMTTATGNVASEVSTARGTEPSLDARLDTIEATLGGGSAPFDITCFYPGVPAADAVLLRVPFAREVSFLANFSGGYAMASPAATGSTAFVIQKNGSSIGTATFGAGGTSASFSTSAISFAAGDIISIVGSATPDTTLANICFVLPGTR